MVCAIVLAAGRSRRMGAQKLLLPLGGRPVIARVVDEVIASPVRDTFVVVGSDEASIRDALAGRPVHFVTNPETGGEMLSSVRWGLAAMPDDCVGAAIALGDQPDVTREVIATLVEAFEATGRGIVVPTHAGRRGHPIVVSLRYRDEILTQYGDVGLRGLLHAHAEDVLEVEVHSPDILEDLDEPGDYERAQARFLTSRGAGRSGRGRSARGH